MNTWLTIFQGRELLDSSRNKPLTKPDRVKSNAPCATEMSHGYYLSKDHTPVRKLDLSLNDQF